MKTNEKNLIELAKNGDENAISKLYELHKNEVYRFIYFKVGSQDDAEDIFQEVMLGALQSLGRFKGEVSFLHWCYQISRNKIAYFWRQHYQKSVIELDENIDINSDDVFSYNFDDQSENDGFLNAKEDENKKIVSNLIHEIEPPNYGILLKLRFVESKTLSEIATIMNITLNNAKVMQNRALKKATKMLTNKQ